jgi:hypothetical protein
VRTTAAGLRFPCAVDGLVIVNGCRQKFMAVAARVDIEGGDAADLSTGQADVEVGPLGPLGPYLVNISSGVEALMLGGGPLVVRAAGKDGPAEGGES